MQPLYVDEGFTLCVGEQFKLFSERITELAAATELLNGGMLIIALYLPDMTSEEVDLIRNHKINVRLLRNNDYAIYLLQFGETEMIFEITFDPFLYSSKKQQDLKKSNLFVITGIDATTNEIKVLRSANMPKAMYNTIVEIWETSCHNKFYSKTYKHWVTTLRKDYGVMDLWNMSTPIGMLGE